MQTNRGQHIASLDSLRGLAALFVVMHHGYNLSEGQLAAGTRPYLGWLDFGHVAVGVFIVLSGFCLLLPVVVKEGRLEGGASGFLQRRARRILPPYYASLVLGYALLLAGWGGWNGQSLLPLSKVSVLSHLALVHNWFGQEAPIPALWSVALEFQIYFVVPLMVVALRWLRLPWVCVLVGMAAHELPRVIHTPPFHWYVGLFAMGGVAAWVVADRDERAAALRARVPWSALAAVMVAVLVACLWRWGWFQKLMAMDYLTGATTAAVVVALALAPEGAVARALRWKPFRTLGLFSYSLYLVHMPLLRVFEILAQRITRLEGLAWFATLELIGVPLCVAAAYLFFLAFEKPFLSRRRAAPEARERPDVIAASAPGEL